MAPAAAAQAGPWVYLVPMLAVVLMVRRNLRARALKVERMWIMPTVLLALALLMLVAQPFPGPAAVALDLAALAVGSALGWWRGRLTDISVDPESHALTSKASPLGMLLILLIFALRYGLRSLGSQTAGVLHISVLEVSDLLVLLAVGLICVQRLEMALRASRLLTQARAARG